MVEGGATCVKYLLFFFNLLFVLTGLAIIVVGAVIELRAREYFNFLDKGFTSTAVLLIVVGVVIFLIAFFGCCGAIKENHCMVLTFSVLLFIVFVLELSAGIAAYVYRSKFRDALTDGMVENFQHYNDTSSDAKKAWNDMQSNLECCGAHNFTDYKDIGWTTGYPESCCSKGNRTESLQTCNNPVTEGCASKLFDEVEKYQYTIGGVGIGIAFVQVIGIVFSCCLVRAIKRQYEVV